MTTGDLTEWTIDYLNITRGVRLRRNNAGMKGKYAYGIKGWADILGYGEDGRFWGIEIKNSATHDRQRGAQTAMLEDAAACGCVVAVITCVEDVTARWPQEVTDVS